jgi:hypothetical protein
MFMSVYFSQAKTDAEKSDISAAYRITEAFGKFLGKFFFASMYMANFINNQGMMCGFELKESTMGNWLGNPINMMEDPSGDPRCRVGILGSLFGAGEPWVMVAILQLITLLLLFFAETMFSEHDIYVEAREKSAGAGEGELELGSMSSDAYEAPVMDVQEMENPSADTI